MSQPQPKPPDVKKIVGRGLTVAGVISVLLIVLGVACNMAHTLSDNPDLEVNYAVTTLCTAMLSLGLVGVVVVIILRALMALVPK
jgi:hypothetical protein